MSIGCQFGRGGCLGLLAFGDFGLGDPVRYFHLELDQEFHDLLPFFKRIHQPVVAALFRGFIVDSRDGGWARRGTLGTILASIQLEMGLTSADSRPSAVT